MTYTPHLNNTGHHWTPDEVVSLDFSGATGVILVNTNRYFMAGTSLRVYNQEYDITRGPLQDMITSCKSWRVFKTLFHNLQLQTMLIIVLYCLAIPLPCERFFAVSRLLGENITKPWPYQKFSSLQYSVIMLIIAHIIKVYLIILKQH